MSQSFFLFLLIDKIHSHLSQYHDNQDHILREIFIVYSLYFYLRQYHYPYYYLYYNYGYLKEAQNISRYLEVSQGMVRNLFGLRSDQEGQVQYFCGCT